MARGRLIDKSLYTNLELGELEIKARYLYIGMIVHADDEGRMKADPRYLKALIFPFDEATRVDSVKTLRDQLAARNLITLYAAGENEARKEYLYHPNWEKWQPLRNDRAHPSDCPKPSPDNYLKKVSTNCQPTDNQLTTKCQPLPNLTEPNLTKPNLTKKEKTLFCECVYLFASEYHELVKKFSENGAKERIQALNDAIMSKGYKYKSHYHTILNWERKNNGQTIKKLSQEEKDRKLIEEIKQDLGEKL